MVHEMHLPYDKFETAEQIFNGVYHGILRQRAFGFTGSGCVYLDGETGARCAIGLFIPKNIETRLNEEVEGGVDAVLVWANRVVEHQGYDLPLGSPSSEECDWIRRFRDWMLAAPGFCSQHANSEFFAQLQNAHDTSASYGNELKDLIKRSFFPHETGLPDLNSTALDDFQFHLQETCMHKFQAMMADIASEYNFKIWSGREFDKFLCDNLDPEEA